ncbi:MAG: DNA repair protein RecO [Clostridiales bacterium]|uniref:DNA repair protein RecO n=2 Tax=Lacrimispora xylanolytica TaxID=29375 RepID=A0ABY7ADT4_9FIRM|nr:DNA repair protein RecO [Lacrimispora xylanolytica]MBS5957411.1 DNA repair protein RecO [Clostridiales bacterium]WAJ24877.1 DNA repair protein RecO [Lacrimispora xylanolytica]
MKDVEKLTGMVIKAAPVGEMDKRLVILTRERGKITAFARGARRPGNQLMGLSRPFAFGQFSLYEGRDSYSLRSAEITNYFEDLAQDMEGTCYGSYFLELADYYARENEDATGLLKLLYQSVRALLKPALKNELVQRIFELKTMVINGEYTEAPPRPASDSANYAWEYVIASPVEHLYTFTLTEPVLEEFARCVEMNKKRFIDREFHSLDILHTMM